jgi:hypothetical protein
LYIDSNYSTPVSNPYVVAAGAAVPPLYANATSVRVVIVTDNGTEDYDPYDPLSLGLTQDVTPQQFGAVGDDVTDDSTAFLNAIAYLQANATSTTYAGYGNKGCGKLVVPKGKYYLGTTTLDIPATIMIEGEGGGFLGCPSTILRWGAATTGLRTQSAVTSGATGPAGTNRGYTAAGSVFRNLFLRGGYAGTEGENHGIHLRVFAVCENVYIDNFPGDGFYAAATIGDATTEGNTSESKFSNCVATNNRNGFFFDGADSNASVIIGCDGRSNRQWGFWDSSFLGNSFYSCHSASNGWDGAIGSVPTGCTIGNSRFYVKPGQATGASTNAPTSSVVTMTIASPGVITWNAHGLVAGTAVGLSTTGALPTGLVAGTTYYVVNPTTNTFQLAATIGGAAINTSGSQSGVHTASGAVDNTYWGYKGPGGTYNGVVPWVTGTTFREGGCYKTDNANATSVFIGDYAESDQNPAQIVGPSLIIGGNLALANSGGGAAIRSDTSGNLQIGPNTGAPSTNITYFESTASVRYLQGRYNYGGVGTNIGSFGFQNGGGILYDVDNVAYSHFFRINGILVGTIDNTGLTMSAGKAISSPTAAFTTSVTVGGGTPITKTVVYTPTLTPASVAAATVAEQTFTVTGLTTADTVSINVPSIANATGIAGVRVSAADTLAIRFVNPTAGALTPTSGVYRIIAHRS